MANVLLAKVLIGEIPEPRNNQKRRNMVIYHEENSFGNPMDKYNLSTSVSKRYIEAKTIKFFWKNFLSSMCNHTKVKSTGIDVRNTCYFRKTTLSV